MTIIRSCHQRRTSRIKDTVESTVGVFFAAAASAAGTFLAGARSDTYTRKYNVRCTACYAPIAIIVTIMKTTVLIRKEDNGIM